MPKKLYLELYYAILFVILDIAVGLNSITLPV